VLRIRLPLLAVVLAGALAVTAAPIADAAPKPSKDGVDGGTSAGDAYLPRQGDTGYDALHYGIALQYSPTTRKLDAVTTIRLRPTARLRSFALDLRGLHVSKVTVDGERATFRQSDEKLRVRPADVLRRGKVVSVRVAYSGRTGQPVDNTDSLFGWVSTDDGALVVSEAYGAPTWFPVNDTPADKATYTITATVPKGSDAVANGRMVGKPTSRDGWRTFRYREDSPMSSYLATVAIGDYDLTRYTVGGLPFLAAIDPEIPAAAKATSEAAVARQPAMIDYFSKQFGPYPFSSAGAIVDRFDIGYSLETQTRPTFSVSATEEDMARHTAHQWFGNSVTLRRWTDIWLNEGLSTYGEWLWVRHTGAATFDDQVARLRAVPADDDLWKRKVGDPGVDDMYDELVYQRGALTLVMLQRKVGMSTMRKILRTWAAEHRYGTATTKQFIELSERLSGQDLDDFFRTWLYTAGKPSF
jgi:aminopeptidase N